MRSATIFISILGLASALPLENVIENAMKYRDHPVIMAHATAPKYWELNNLDDRDVGRNSPMEQLLLDLIENLREVMVTGTESIPILDPLQIDQLDLDLGTLGLGDASYLRISDAVVSQLSTFVIDDLSFGITGINAYRFDATGHISRVVAKAGKYGLNISMMGFSIFGNGDAEINLINPAIKVNLTINLRITIRGIFANINGGDIRFYLPAFESKLTGMFDSDITNDFVNMFLSHLVPELVEFYEDEISRTLTSVVIDLANGFLAELNLIGLIPFPLDNLELPRALEQPFNQEMLSDRM